MHTLDILEKAARPYYDFNEDGRPYHNWDHAVKVLNHVGYDASLSVQIAAMWHDAIYIPRGRVNEMASSNALTYEWVKNGIKDHIPILHAANKLIECTTVDNHLRTTALDPVSDLALLLDADLAALAAPYDVFVNNQANIIMENGGDPDKKESRVLCGNFLEAFLTCRPFIYHTDHFREMFEPHAKENINKYIATKGST